jgi:hypothetical protein
MSFTRHDKCQSCLVLCMTRNILSSPLLSCKLLLVVIGLRSLERGHIVSLSLGSQNRGSWIKSSFVQSSLSSHSLSIAHWSLLPTMHQSSELDECGLIDRLGQIICLLIMGPNWVYGDFATGDIIAEWCSFTSKCLVLGLYFLC